MMDRTEVPLMRGSMGVKRLGDTLDVEKIPQGTRYGIETGQTSTSVIRTLGTPFAPGPTRPTARTGTPAPSRPAVRSRPSPRASSVRTGPDEAP